MGANASARRPFRFAALLTLTTVVAACSSGTTAGRSEGTAATAGPGGSVVAGPAGERPRIVPIADAAPVSGTKGDWAGPVAGSNAYLAVVSDGAQVVAYLCDSDKTAVWFRGDVGAGGDTPTILTSDGGRQLQVQLGADRASAVVESDDGATAVDLPAVSGQPVLHRAEGDTGDTRVTAGWVTLPDGSQRGSLILSGATTSTITSAPTLSGSNLTVSVVNQTLDLQPNPISSGAPVGAPRTNEPFEWVMVTLGDSYGSGEGAPLTPGQFSADGSLPGGATKEVWSKIEAPSNNVEACHRSDRSAGYLVPDDLRKEFPDVKIIARSFACSGAVVDNLIDTPYAGADGNVDFSVPPQITTLQKWLLGTDTAVPYGASRPKIDLLYMNIGGNDVGFGPIVATCITGSCDTDAAVQRSLADGLQALPSHYVKLAGALNGLSVTRADGTRISVVPAVKVISQAPDPLRDQAGVLCNGPTADRMKGEQLKELVTAEADWAEREVVAKLNAAIAAAANAHGWVLVGTIADAYRTHGVCSSSPWINNIADALKTQGRDIRLDFWSGLGANLIGLNLSAGMVHPNADGFRGTATEVTKAVRPQFVRRWTPPTPTGLREAAVTVNSNFEVRWNDVAVNDARVELEESPLRNGAFVDPLVTTLPSNTQRAEIPISGVYTARYRVRACGPAKGEALCSPWSPPFIGSNQAPLGPTLTKVSPGGAGAVFFQFTDASGPTKPGGPASIVAVLRADGQTTRQFVIRGPGGNATQAAGLNFPPGTWQVAIKACNVAACSGESARLPVTVT